MLLFRAFPNHVYFHFLIFHLTFFIYEFIYIFLQIADLPVDNLMPSCNKDSVCLNCIKIYVYIYPFYSRSWLARKCWNDFLTYDISCDFVFIWWKQWNNLIHNSSWYSLLPFQTQFVNKEKNIYILKIIEQLQELLLFTINN